MEADDSHRLRCGCSSCGLGCWLGRRTQKEFEEVWLIFSFSISAALIHIVSSLPRPHNHLLLRQHFLLARIPFKPISSVSTPIAPHPHPVGPAFPIEPTANRPRILLHHINGSSSTQAPHPRPISPYPLPTTHLILSSATPPLACSTKVPIQRGILSQRISRKEFHYLETKAVSIPMPASKAHFIPSVQNQLPLRNRQLPIPLSILLPQLTFQAISLRSGDMPLTLLSRPAADRTYQHVIT